MDDFSHDGRTGTLGLTLRKDISDPRAINSQPLWPVLTAATTSLPAGGLG